MVKSVFLLLRREVAIWCNKMFVMYVGDINDELLTGYWAATYMETNRHEIS